MVELLVAHVESGWVGPSGQPPKLFPVAHSAEGWRDVSPDVHLPYALQMESPFLISHLPG